MGERTLTTAVKAEIIKDQVQLGLFVEIIFDDGAFRVWSGLNDFTLNGNIFTGVGILGRIDKIEESASDIKAATIAMSLSGIPSSMLSTVLLENFQGRPVSIWLGLFDSTWTLINDAVKLNGFRLDYPVINEGGETATITVYAESILADLERPRVRRYTDADQKSLYSGDRGLEFVAGLQNKEVTWSSA